MSALTEAQRDTLVAVLDEIIPPSEDGRLPGAGELGLGPKIEAALAEALDLPKGLEALDEVARRSGAERFAALEGAARTEALTEYAEAAPGFLPGLIFHTYTSYYQHARVVEALGLEARPPHPKGYEMEENDLSLLDPVRARPPLYRKGEA